MPLRHGAARSVHDAAGNMPNTSVLTALVEAHQMCGDFVSLENSLLSQQSISSGSCTRSFERQTAELTSFGAAPLRIPCWWAWLDSGMVSTLLFAVSNVVYLVAIPLGDSQAKGEQVKASWLNLVGALLMVSESLIDLVWSLKSWFTNRMIGRRVEVLQAVMPNAIDSHKSLLRSIKGCTLRLDGVHWDFWTALFFLIASLLALMQSFLDPNIVGDSSWLYTLTAVLDMSNADLSSLCGEASAWLFLLDAMLCLMGRYSYNRQVAPTERLVIVKLWLARGMFMVDWPVWGDVMFAIGAASGVWDAYDGTSNLWLPWIENVLWLCDSLFYFLGCLPTLRGMLKNGNQHTPDS